MKYTVILLSKSNGKQCFTDDCLKDFVEKNKTLESQIGKVTNIRLKGEEVLGDINIEFKLKAATTGAIKQSIFTTEGKVITEFEPKKVEILIGVKLLKVN